MTSHFLVKINGVLLIYVIFFGENKCSVYTHMLVIWLPLRLESYLCWSNHLKLKARHQGTLEDPWTSCIIVIDVHMLAFLKQFHGFPVLKWNLALCLSILLILQLFKLFMHNILDGCELIHIDFVFDCHAECFTTKRWRSEFNFGRNWLKQFGEVYTNCMLSGGDFSRIWLMVAVFAVLLSGRIKSC